MDSIHTRTEVGTVLESVPRYSGQCRTCIISRLPDHRHATVGASDNGGTFSRAVCESGHSDADKDDGSFDTWASMPDMYLGWSRC